MGELRLRKQSASVTPSPPTNIKTIFIDSDDGLPKTKDEFGTVTVLGGNVYGPTGSFDSTLAAFDGTTGKLIKDTGYLISELLDRANHTGTQLASTVSDFSSAADARVAIGIAAHVADSDPHPQYAMDSDVTAAIAYSIQRANHTGTQTASTISNFTSAAQSALAGLYEVPLTFSTGLTRTVNTITVNTTQNISRLSNITSNGFVKTTGSNGTLSIDTNTYATTGSLNNYVQRAGDTMSGALGVPEILDGSNNPVFELNSTETIITGENKPIIIEGGGSSVNGPCITIRGPSDDTASDSVPFNIIVAASDGSASVGNRTLDSRTPGLIITRAENSSNVNIRGSASSILAYAENATIEANGHSTHISGVFLNGPYAYAEGEASRIYAYASDSANIITYGRGSLIQGYFSSSATAQAGEDASRIFGISENGGTLDAQGRGATIFGTDLYGNVYAGGNFSMLVGSALSDDGYHMTTMFGHDYGADTTGFYVGYGQKQFKVGETLGVESFSDFTAHTKIYAKATFGSPSVVANEPAGGGASASLSTGSTDIAGEVRLTVGSSSGSGDQLRVTFSSAYDSPYDEEVIVVFSPANMDAANAARQKGIYVTNIDNTGFTIAAEISLQGGTSPKWNYQVIGIR